MVTGFVFAGVTVLLLVLVLTWHLPGTAAQLTLRAITLVMFVLATTQFRIARAWSRAERFLADPGFRGVVGAGRPLHTVRPGQPVKRRLPASVVPVRTEDGPLAAGTGLVMHGRPDGVSLAEGDEVTVWQIEARRTTSGEPGPKGRYLLRRESDGEIFAGGTSTVSVF